MVSALLLETVMEQGQQRGLLGTLSPPAHLSSAHPIAVNHSKDLLSTTAKAFGLGAQQGLLLPSSQLQTPTLQLTGSSLHTTGRFPGTLSQTGARTEQRAPSSLLLIPSPSSRPVVPVGCTAWRAMFPRDGVQSGVLLGFSTRHLCCLVCIRLTEPRLLGQPRAVRLDKNNREEGQEEGLSGGSALQGHTVGRGPEILFTQDSMQPALLRSCFITQLQLGPLFL